jgi:hypothetical protein
VESTNIGLVNAGRRRRTRKCTTEEEDEPTLFIVSAAAIEPIVDQAHPIEVHLDEGRLFVQLGENGGGDGVRWILDSGATNHMMGM